MVGDNWDTPPLSEISITYPWLAEKGESMAEQFQIPVENRFSGEVEPKRADSDRALKNFRYVVGSVNADALKVWADLWMEFQAGVTPNGLVLPEMQKGFTPSCGWTEFLEKFWLLKHYLDYTHKLCK
jgi:hypothetical protein